MRLRKVAFRPEINRKHTKIHLTIRHNQGNLNVCFYCKRQSEYHLAT